MSHLFAPNHANACASNLERGLDRQEEIDRVFEAEKREYKLMKDWKDVALQTEDMIPILLLMIDSGMLLEAKAYVAAMLEKAADDHASLVADRYELSTW